MDLIDEKMKFVDFKEFYKKKDLIKSEFNKLSLREKQIYKLYVYSNRLINEFKLNKIWEYLNEPFGSAYYISGDMLSAHL